MTNSTPVLSKPVRERIVKQPDWWEREARDAYIFDSDGCKQCGNHKPVNKYGVCEFCDKVMLDYKPTEEVL